MTLDSAAADYCPTCGEPRERHGAAERFGLSLYGTVLIYGDNRARLRPAVANFARVMLERRIVSHEMLLLRVTPDAGSDLIRVYAKRLRDTLREITGGEVALTTLHSWGYELTQADVERAAA